MKKRQSVVDEMMNIMIDRQKRALLPPLRVCTDQKIKKTLSLCITGVSGRNGKLEEVTVSITGNGQFSDRLYLATEKTISTMGYSKPQNKAIAERLIDTMALQLKNNLKQIL